MEFLSSFSWQSLAAAGGLVALLIGGNWAKIKSLVPKIGGTATGDAADVEAMRACRLLIARFTAVNCSEGLAAAKTCGNHLLDQHDPGT